MGAADLIVQGIPPGRATGRGRSKRGPGNVLGGLPDPPGLVEQFAFGGHEFPFRYVNWGTGAGGVVVESLPFVSFPQECLPPVIVDQFTSAGPFLAGPPGADWRGSK